MASTTQAYFGDAPATATIWTVTPSNFQNIDEVVIAADSAVTNFQLDDIVIAAATASAPAPTVSDGNISITSSGTGTGGAYKVGDTVIVSWNDTVGGDDNASSMSITGVTADFTAFGGGSAVAASNSSDTWTASYTIVSGAIDSTNLNVSVTATSAGGSTTRADSSNLTVDNEAPTVTDANISISGASGTGGAFVIGDTVTATWNNTAGGDNNSDTISAATVNFGAFGGGAAVAASNSSGTWTGTYTITSGSIQASSLNVSVTATDNAGNTTTTADTTNATVDNQAPSLSVVTAVTTPTIDSTPDFTFNTDQAGTLTVGGSCGSSSEGAVSSGDITIALTQVDNSTALANATYTDCTVTVTDDAGNASAPLSIASFTVDATARNISIADVALDENSGTMTFTVTSSAAAAGDITFNFATSDGSATAVAAEDYTATAGSGTISDGATSTTIDVALGGDTVVEADETFTMTLSGLSGFGAVLTDGVATGTLNNDDQATVTIADVAGNEDGGAITVTVTLDNAVDGGFDVNVSTADGSATTADNDYSAVTNQTLTFAGAAGENETFTVTPTADAATEADETLVVSMSSLTPVTVASGDINITDGATVTINNDDDISFSVNDPTVAEGNSGSTTLTFTVSLDSPAPAGGATVDYAVTAGTAASSDFVAISTTTLPFAVGETSQTVDVTVNGDTTVEVDETVVITLSNATGTDVAISDASGTGTITNDDTATVTIADVAVNEDTGIATVTLALDNAVDGGFSVEVSTADGTATLAGSDYAAVTGATETFAGTAGETETFDITIGVDTTIEPDETINVSMSNVVSGTVASGDVDITDTATVTILNDDVPAAPSTPDLVAASDAGVSDSDNITNDSTPTLEGTALANSTVALTSSLDGALGSTSATGSGNWSLTTSTLTEGVHTITATATDAGGNTSAASTGLSITIDVTAPAIPSAPDLIAASDSGSSDTDNVTNDASPTFEGTGPSNEGVALVSSVAADNSVNSAVAAVAIDGSGSWTATAPALSDGSRTIIAVAFDLAGNSSTFASGLTINVDTTAPAAPSQPDLIAASDTGPSSTDNYTNDTTPTFEGTAESGATISLRAGTATILGTAVVDGSGDWSVVPSAQTDGTRSYKVVAMDVAGNVSADSPGRAITIDTAAPSLVSFTRDTPSTQSTGADTLVFAVTFDEQMAFGGLADSDFDVSGTSATGVIGGSAFATEFTLTVSGGDLASLNGVVGADVAAGNAIVDRAGNPLVSVTPTGADETYILVNDVLAPTLTAFARNTPAVETTDADALIFDITFDETVVNVTADDFDITGTTATGSLAGSGSAYTLTLSGGDLVNLNATVGLDLAAAQDIADTAGNALGAGEPTTDETYSVLNDVTPPDVTITTASADPVSGIFAVTVTFTEDVTGFAVGDLTVGNGSASNLAGSGDTYTADITPSADGTVTVDVAAGSAQDAAGNDNTAATQFSIETDGTAPGVSITTASADPVSGIFAITVTFTEDVTGFTVGDLTVGNGSASNFQATSASVYTADITPASDGTVTVDVAAGSAQDAAGNDNTAATQFSIESDGTRPGPTITTASADPVSGAFAITVTFTEDVTGFTLGDMVVGNGSAGNFAATSASVYTADITPSADGPVTVDVAASVAQDAAGNDNTAATQFSIESDGTAPTLTSVTIASNNPFNPLNSQSSTDYARVGTEVTVSLTFDEALDTPPTVTIAGQAASVTGSGTSWTARLTVNGATPEGVAAINAAGYADAAGNVGATVTDVTDASEVIVDRTAPTLNAFTRSFPTDATTDADILVFLAAFSETVRGVNTLDFEITGLASPSIGITPLGDSARLRVSGGDLPNLIGTVGINLAAAQNITDFAGNPLPLVEPATDEIFTIENDLVPPTLTITSTSTGPVSAAFPVSFTFDEDVTGFAVGDIVVGNGSAGNLQATSGSVYTADITPSGSGQVSVDVPAGAAQDGNSNDNDAATQFSIVADVDAPVLTAFARNTPAVETTDADALIFDISFSETVVNVTVDDFAITGTTATGILAGSGSAYTLTVVGGDLADLNATVGVDLTAAQDIADTAGNALGAGEPATDETYSVLNDVTPPDVTITTASADPVSGTFVITVTFTEDVTGFTVGDLTVGNGSATNLAVTSASVYTVDITPASDGTVTVDVAAGVAQDAAGNDNIAAAQFSIENDETAPGVFVFDGAGRVVVSGPFTLSVQFTEPVTGFEASDFTVANGSILQVVPVSSSFWVVEVGPTADGLVTVDFAAGGVVDAGNNPNTAATSFQIENDETQPDVTITTTSADPVSGTFAITVTFTEDVTGFTVGDLTVGNGSAGNFQATSASVYTADITPTSDGTITVDVAAGAAQDAAGNDNTAATQFSIESDGTAPGVTLQSTAPNPFNGGFVVRIVFDEAVTGFTIDDVTVGNGSAISFTAVSASMYDVGIGATADGTVTLDVAAGVAQDAAGNGNTAATQFSIEIDATAPDVTITTTSADPVSGVFPITVTFTEDVTGFAVGDISVGNGAASNFAGSGAVYTADITPTSDGTVTVDVAAGVAQDAAGNVNSAAPQFSIESDGTAPDVTITTASADPVSGTFAVTVTFTEDVTGFAVGDLMVGNGSAGNFQATSASIYTADITPASDGTVTVDVAAGVAQDAAGNDNSAAAQFSIESDGTRPGLTITTPSSEVSGPFTASFTFTEAVSGFDLADINVVNGAASGFTGSGEAYTATITPSTVGALAIEVAEAAAQDAAGNLNLAGEVSVDVTPEAPTVALLLASSIANPGDVAGVATLSNPGSDPLPFSALANVDWITVTPNSGTIASLGSLDLTITLNESVNALDPGVYFGAVTVTIGGSAVSSTASAGMGLQNAASTTLVEIPITLTVQQRFGTVELVATTPAGASGEASFTYASDLAAFDGVTLTTANGRANVTASDILFGEYAISQSAPAGWRVESISCAGDLDGGSTFDVSTGQAVIDVDPGEALVCTYENVRDEDAVRLATQRAILNFMARRADRIVAAAPDLSNRFSERETTQRGAFNADMDGSGRSTMAFSASLAGMRNAAAADTPNIAGVTNYERPFMEGWDIWLAAEVARVNDNRAGDDASSDFAIAQLGIDRQISDTLILGFLAQYDWMDEVSAEINTAAGAIAGARVEGEGWMAGPYGVWKIDDQLILDAMALYGTSQNTVNPLGLYADDFETDRFMIRANLTGEFQSGNWRLRPQASLTHFEETQSAYTDSLNIAIPEQSLSLGRFTAGPEVAWRNQSASGRYIELSTRMQAVWDYQAAELLNDAGVLTGGNDDLRADARFGVNAGFASGMTLGFEAGFAGIGVGDFEATTGRFQLRIPFGASGRGGGAALQGSSTALGLQENCDDRAGQNFAYAAGQMNQCDTVGLSRIMQ